MGNNLFGNSGNNSIFPTKKEIVNMSLSDLEKKRKKLEKLHDKKDTSVDTKNKCIKCIRKIDSEYNDKLQKKINKDNRIKLAQENNMNYFFEKRPVKKNLSFLERSRRR